MDNKNNNSEEKIDLKHADMDKFGAESLNAHGSDSTAELLRREKKARDRQLRGEDAPEKKKNKKIPLWVDILIAILIIAIAAGAIAGIYFVLKYYTDGYKDVTVQYTVIATGENAASTVALKDKTLYLDTEDNSYSMGMVYQVIENTTEEGVTQYTMIISTQMQYRRGEGYLISDNRVAVGSDYVLRAGEQEYSVTVVEIREVGKRG